MAGPKWRRTSGRIASTARIAPAGARFRWMKAVSRSFAIVEAFDKALQPRHLPGRQVAVLGVVGDQRGELAAEQAVQQALALALDIVGAADQRAIAGAA